MIHQLRRIGFPPFKRSRGRSRRSLAQLTHRLHVSEPLEPRMLLATDVLSAWQNPANAADVDNNGHVVSLDALAVLNALSRGGDALLAYAGGRSLAARPAVPASPDAPFMDVNGDQSVTTEDAEGVLSTLNQAAEGESGDVSIEVGDGVFVIYNSTTGELRVDSDLYVTTLEILSASGIFTGSAALNLGGTFDIDSDTKIFKMLPQGFRDLTFGTVAQSGLSEAAVRRDLTIAGSHLKPQGWPQDRPATLSNKQVKMRLQITDLNSNPITQINHGDDFYLRATVQDVRAASLVSEDSEGVFAAYLDVQYNSALATAAGTIQYAAAYTNAKAGTVSAGLLDEAGATSTSLSALDTTERELFRIRMTATGGGSLTFDADAADVAPQHDTLMFGGTAAVDDLDIQFIDSQTVTVLDTPTDQDLVAFAKAIAATGAKFYGAFWCSACHAQQDRFQDGGSFLPYVESSKPDRTQTPEAIAAGITSYPTWVFADNSRLVGAQTLETLSQKTGVAIPQSNKPFISPIDNKTLLAGAPLHVAIDGYDPNGGPLTYTITSSNPSLVSAIKPQNNRSMRVVVESYGEMVFQLFEDLAPRPAGRVIELAQDGFYDGLTFHRIVNNFMIQGGDPNGNGTGGSDLPDFDDQFHVDLQHTGTGLLSFAKSSDDTNNSQFFITEGSARHLDFNHSIFGQLIEGEKVRDNISNTEVVAQTSGEVSKPKITVFMDTVEIFSDTENSLVRLKGTAGQTGTATITVTARDQDGHEFVETFDVTVSPDTVNGGPFLNDIPAITTKVDTPVTFQLSAQDVEGDSFTFSGVNGSNLTLNVNATTGQVTATPKAGFIGTATATVGVRATGATSAFDNQLITVQVLPNTPVVTLLSGSDSGISNSDRLTNLTNLQFQVSNVVSGAVVSLYADGSKIGEGTADGTTITITTANLSALGDGEYDITGKQSVTGQTSEASTVLGVTLDQTAPGNFTSTPPTTGIAGQAIAYDANHPEEGQSGFRYSLSSGPTGATVNATTGQLSWTPTNVQVGAQTFGIVATDAAGNSKTQTVNLTIDQQELMRFRLKVVDADGDPIQAIAAGQTFTLQVLVQDIRDEALGVFAAYVDATYDTARVQLNGSITFGSSFPNVRLGSTTTVGLIDEAGATAGTDPLGSGEFLLMSIPLKALTVGQAVFGANPADDLPIHDTLLRGLNVPLTADQMINEGTTLQIVGATSAQNDEMEVAEDSNPVRMFVLDNDIVIPPTATVTITNVGTPAHGTAQIVTTDQGQAIEYKPAANYVGPDTFSYTIQDSAGGTSTATVTVTVTNVNDPPTALDDTFTVAEDAAATDLNVLVNDNMAPDTGETLKITNVTSAAHGTVTIANNGAVLRYTPAANYSGSDTFTYTLSDGNGGTDQATVTVTVTEVNDAPVVGADTRTINEDTALVLNVSDVLANDNAGPGETGQTLTVTGVNGASTGTVSLQGSTITFTPPANFFGTATFNYTVRDNGTTNGNADPKSTTGTVTVTVSAVNDPPTAVNDTATAQTGGSAIVINVLANDLITPDQGETLSVTSVGAATQGTARRTESGQVEYKPSTTFVGTDSFTYTISDGNGGQSTGTVSVTLQNFVPGGLSGSVFYDLSNDGVWQTGDKVLSGLKVALTGTNAQGQAVNLTSTTGKDGSYKFDQLTSGTYTVTQQQPVFTMDGKDHATVNGVQSPAKNSLTVQLAADGLGTGKLNFAEQRLDPKFAVWEALASSSSTGLYAAVDSTEGRLWSRQDTGWENTDIVDIEFSADKSTLTITILEGTQTKAATVARSDHSKVQVIGRDGQAHLVRFNGAKTAYNFQQVAASAAEGESARDQIFAQDSW